MIDPALEALFDRLMGIALEEAVAASAHGDVPVGAVVARLSDGEVLTRRHNERELLHDPIAHAEVLALSDAARALSSWRLDGCVLVATLEPCPMCAGAAVNARIPVVVFGAADPKAGALGSVVTIGVDGALNHRFVVHSGIRAEESARLLREFFAVRRP